MACVRSIFAHVVNSCRRTRRIYSVPPPLCCSRVCQSNACNCSETWLEFSPPQQCSCVTVHIVRYEVRNRKLFEPTEDIIKTVMKPFRVALISLLFNSFHFYHSSVTLSSANNLTERAIGLVYGFRSLCDITRLFAFFFRRV